MNDDRADLHLDRTPTGRLDEALPAPSVTPLSRLHNYRISEGDPDVRGWEVLGADGRKIGEVDDLLVDTEALRVRYLNVNLDSDLFGEEAGTSGTARLEAPPRQAEADGVSTGVEPYGTPLSATAAMGGLGPLVSETLVRATLSDEENRLTDHHHQGLGARHVLIPIGNARLDPDHDRILLQGLSAAMAAGLPDYTGEDLDRGYETSLRGRFDPLYSPATPAPDRQGFYAHDLYDEDRFYSPRRVAGLEPGRGSTGPDREVTGKLDRAVDSPDHNQTRDDVEAETVLPGRGRS
jgi:PRC-barrel domain